MRALLLVFFTLVFLPLFGQLDIVLQTGHKGTITSLNFHETQKLLISNDENSCVLWDLKTRKQFASIQSKEVIVSSGFLGEEDFFIAYENKIVTYNLISQEVIKTYKSNGPIKQVEAYGNKLYCFAQNLYSINIENDEESEITSVGVEVTSFSLSNLGEKINIITPTAISIVDAKLLQEVYSIKLKRARDVFYNDKEKRLTVTDVAYSVRTYEVQEKGLRLEQLINNPNDNGAFTKSCIGSQLSVVGDKKGFLTVFENNSGKIISNRKNKSGLVSELQINHEGTVIAAAGERGVIQLYDADLESPLHTFKAFSPAATAIVPSNNEETTFLIGYDNGEIKEWDIQSHSVNLIKGDAISSLDRVLVPQIKIINLNINGGFYSKTYRQNGVEKVKYYKFTFENNHTFYSSKKVIGGDKKELKNIEKVDFELKGKTVTSVGPKLKNGRRLIGVSDGFIYLIDGKNDILLKMVSPLNKAFFYLTNDNYYFASKNSIPFVGARLNNQIVGFEQIDLVYNRPDKILKVLTPNLGEEYFSLLEDAYAKRLSKLGVEEKDLLAFDKFPTLSSDLDKLPLKSKTKEIQFTLSALSEIDLKALHVSVNGVPVLGKKGREIEGKKLESTEKIQLSEGTNNIEIYVENINGMKSLRDKGTVNFTSTYQPSLYVLAIGSGKFKDSDYDLNFAQKDAKDLSMQFQEHENKFFKSIQTTVIGNEEVTNEKVFSAIEDLKVANEDDVVIVFFAGHGVLDSELDYYLSANPMDFKNPANGGISFDDFENKLSVLKSRNKMLLIDACHSGEVDKEEFEKNQNVIDSTLSEDEELFVFRSGEGNFKLVEGESVFELSKNIFTDLRANSGLITISSAGAAEYALEGGQWNNGAFTYCLLNGLIKMNADLNKDKKVDVNELQQYLFIEVPKLTNGKQTPRSRVELREQNFEIW